MNENAANSGRMTLSAWLAVMVLVAFYAPQTFHTRGFVPAFLMFIVWGALVAMRPRIYRVFTQFSLEVFSMGLFVLVALTNYFFRGGGGMGMQILFGSIASIFCFFVTAYYAGWQMGTYQRIMRWTVIVLALLVLPSLPILYAYPGIGRPLCSEFAGRIDNAISVESVAWGVGSFALYTMIGVALPSWLWLLSGLSARNKFFMLLVIGILMVAVVLSTFTMAAALMMVGVAVWLLAAPFMRRSANSGGLFLMMVGLLLVVVIAIPYLAESSEAIKFVYDKVLRLVSGISEGGMVSGEETGRGARFMLSFETFLEYPVFGCGLARDEDRIGGHCSLIDHWAMFGLLGYWPWFLLQTHCTYRCVTKWRANCRDARAFGSVVSWGLYWIASLCNPTAFSILPAMLIFTDCYTPATVARATLATCNAARQERRFWAVRETLPSRI